MSPSVISRYAIVVVDGGGMSSEARTFLIAVPAHSPRRVVINEMCDSGPIAQPSEQDS